MRTPDLHAPRHRYKFFNPNGSDFIKKFREKYPQYKQYSDKVLKDIINKQSKAICNAAITNRDGVELQQGVGKIFVGTTPPLKRKVVAWDKSVKIGSTVYYTNHKTDGRTLKIFYSNYGTKYKLDSRKLWEFSATRKFSENVSVRCSENYQMYHKIDSNYAIWNQLLRRNHATKAKRSTDKALLTYNEFDLE